MSVYVTDNYSDCYSMSTNHKYNTSRMQQNLTTALWVFDVDTYIAKIKTIVSISGIEASAGNTIRLHCHQATEIDREPAGGKELCDLLARAHTGKRQGMLTNTDFTSSPWHLWHRISRWFSKFVHCHAKSVIGAPAGKLLAAGENRELGLYMYTCDFIKVGLADS